MDQVRPKQAFAKVFPETLDAIVAFQSVKRLFSQGIVSISSTNFHRELFKQYLHPKTRDWLGSLSMIC